MQLVVRLCYQGVLSLNAVAGQVGFIYDCWKNGGGVMCLQLENGSTSLEAHCREAAITSCLGLGQLQNKVNGSKYGQMKSWSDVKLKNFGLLTLYISFMKFVIKRQPVIRASDVPFNVGTRKCSKNMFVKFAEIFSNKELILSVCYIWPQIYHSDMYFLVV